MRSNHIFGRFLRAAIPAVVIFTGLGPRLISLVHRHVRTVVGGATLLAFGSFPLRAQLTTADFNLPIAKKQGSEYSSPAGYVPLGTPMRMSFSYDPADAIIYSGEFSATHFFPAHGAYGSLTIAGVSWGMTNLSITVLHNAETETAHGLFRGYMLFFEAATGDPNPDGAYASAYATLLWPTGTLQDFSPILPLSPPRVTVLSAYVGANDPMNTAQFHSSEYPDSPTVPLVPVPEPATCGLVGASLLALLAGLRTKRDATRCLMT